MNHDPLFFCFCFLLFFSPLVICIQYNTAAVLLYMRVVGAAYCHSISPVSTTTIAPVCLESRTMIKYKYPKLYLSLGHCSVTKLLRA